MTGTPDLKLKLAGIGSCSGPQNQTMNSKLSHDINRTPMGNPKLGVVLLGLFFAFTEGEASAATKTWDGSSSGNWSAVANWTNNVAPVNGDDLVFPPGAFRFVTTNDLSALHLKSITLSGSNYVLRGNSISLTNGLAATCLNRTNSIEFAITLSAVQTFNSSNAGAALILNGQIANAASVFNVDGSGQTFCNGLISGAGALAKFGAGQLTLTASNSYSGLTSVNIGTLRIENDFGLGALNNGTIVNPGGALVVGGSAGNLSDPLTLNGQGPAGSGALQVDGGVTWNTDVTLGSDTTISSPNFSLLTINGAISGAASLTKIGNGTLVYEGTGANSYSGTTFVNEGILELNKSALNVALVGPLVIGQGFGAPNAAVQLNAATQIDNNSAVTINDTGLLELASHQDAIGSLTGSGNVHLGSAFLNVGVNNSSTLFSGIISGNGGSLSKLGTGTFTLTGSNTYTGPTTVSAGTLLINGFQPQSPVAVLSGATLGGSGTVGDISNSGTVAPGAGPGILTSSNANFTAASTFSVELAGSSAGSGYDQLKVRGTNSLGGSTLNVSIGAGFAPVEGQALVIVENDGAEPITGTFAGLAQGAIKTVGGLRFRVSYTGFSGNDVTLTLTNPPLKNFSSNLFGGNGNGILESNECNHLMIVLTNTTTSPISNIFAMLSTTSPGAIVTQPNSFYPAVSASGVVSNNTLFQISTLPTLVCPSKISLTLTISSSIGTFASAFLIPTACADGGGACAFCPGTFVGSLSAADPVQSGQLIANAAVSSCTAPKTCPGTLSNTNLHYDLYRFTNSSPKPTCARIQLTASCGPGASALTAAYLDNFDPSNVCSNYLADLGLTLGPGGSGTYSCLVPSSHALVVVVSELIAGAGCTNYSLTVSGFECPPPLVGVSLTPDNRVKLDWPTSAAGYLLEATPTLSPSSFSQVTNEPVVSGSGFAVTNNAPNANQFYRLRKPL